MYLHLGQDRLVPFGEVLGIFDLDNITYDRRAARFLDHAQREHSVILCTDDLPKSVVLCDSGVYLSQLSPATLRTRAGAGGQDQEVSL